MYPNKQKAVNILPVADGLAGMCRTSGELAMTGSTAGYVIPSGNDPENWFYQIRATGIYAYSGGTSTAFHTSRTSTTAPARNSTGGAAIFTEGGNQLAVLNSGTNNKGGFTVHDLSMDKVIATVEPIGTLGTGTGGNASAFNWLFVERNGERDYDLYQYCPANGMAAYHLYNPDYNGAELIGSTAQGDALTAEISGNTLTANMNGLSLYTASGIKVAATTGHTISTDGLAPGIYILVHSSGQALKIAV